MEFGTGPILLAVLACLPVLGMAAIPLTSPRLGQRAGHGVIYGLTLIAALALAALGLSVLAGGEIIALRLPLGLPWVESRIEVDFLSAFFLLIVNGVAALASLYALGYGAHIAEPRRVTPLFPLFLLGMNVALIAADAFTFLVGWEFMSLASWLMVLAQHRSNENREAARLYLIMAVFGTFCLLPVFGLLGGVGGAFDFASMRAAPLGPVASVAVVALALMGAGSKAGLVPLHVWLPLAHPAAPSHVSALMSGVMTKVALYGLIRILFDLHGEVAWWWGAALMVFGALTAVLGVLYALMQTDLKRLLAYSTVENVGIITIALGLSLAFKDEGQPLLAALALVAALYHVVNHAAFKSLLFLGAGAVLSATGERRLDGLGGLLNRMPVTGTTFLIGAAAASSLPPLNGFVSEWLILQTLFKGPELHHWAMKFGVPVVGALMALSAALAAAAFVRAFGIAFLGRPRSQAAEAAVEQPRSMGAAMIVLAALCVVLGVIPVTITGAIAIVAEPLVGIALPPSVGLGWPWLSPVSDAGGSYSATLMMLVGGVMVVLAGLVVHGFGSRALRRAPAWDCGHVEAHNPATQYSAESFAQPLRRVFGGTVFAAREQVEMPPPESLEPARFRLTWHDPVWRLIYTPLGRLIEALAQRANKLQYLSIRQYLMMMFATLVVLLIVVAVRQ